MSTDLEILRNKFYDDMQREYGINSEEVKRILVDNKHTSFNALHVPEYGLLVKQYASRLEAVKQNRKAAENHLDACPIPGCTGRKVRTMKPWPWKCSVSGFRHYLAIRCAEHLVPKEAAFDVVTAKAKEIITQWENIDEANKEAEKTQLQGT